jgi:hypothetical protein
MKNKHIIAGSRIRVDGINYTVATVIVDTMFGENISYYATTDGNTFFDEDIDK